MAKKFSIGRSLKEDFLNVILQRLSCSMDAILKLQEKAQFEYVLQGPKCCSPADDLYTSHRRSLNIWSNPVAKLGCWQQGGSLSCS